MNQIFNPYFKIFSLLFLVNSFQVFNVFSQEDAEKESQAKDNRNISKKDSLNCSERYEIALNLYENGQIDTALLALEPCLTKPRRLRKEASKETSAFLYGLAANSSFFLDHPDTARLYVKKMLAFQPYYEPKASDISRTKVYLNQLFTQPKFSLGIFLSYNVTLVELQQFRSVFVTDKGVSRGQGNYSPTLLSYGLASSLEYTLNRYVKLAFEPGFSFQSFKYKSDFPTDILNRNVGIDYRQNMSFANIPFIGRYYFFPRKSYRPYIQGGWFYQVLLSGRKKTGNTELDIANQLNRNNTGFILGGGITFDKEKYSLGIDLRYKPSINRVNDTGNILINDQNSDTFAYEFYDIPDDIKLRNIKIAFRYVRYLNFKVFEKKTFSLFKKK